MNIAHFDGLHPAPLGELSRKKVVRLLALNQGDRDLAKLKRHVLRQKNISEHFTIKVHSWTKNYDKVGVPGTVHGLKLDDLLSQLNLVDTDVFGFLMYDWNQTFMASVASRIREQNSAAVIIFLCSQARFSGEDLLRHNSCIDYAMRGNPKWSFGEFLEGLLDGEMFWVVNLYWRRGNQIASISADNTRAQNKQTYLDITIDFPDSLQLADNHYKQRNWRLLLSESWLGLRRFLYWVRSTVEHLSENYDELAAIVDRKLSHIRYADLSIPYRALGFLFLSQRLNHLMDRVAMVCQNEFFPGFIAGKTRETYLLWKEAQLGQIIEVGHDGFCFDGRKISGSPSLSSMIRERGVERITINEYFSPFYFYSDFRYLTLVLATQLYLVFLFGMYVAPTLLEHPVWTISVLPWNVWLLVIPFYLG
ncbi:MAG: hypothetical protein HN348_31725, partial [Proteobacteria bacterium]|nr:hypothetical protein [Pseudomonadota bacterium]